METNKKLLEISKKVHAMSMDEVEKRMKEISAEMKDLSDLDVKASEDLQMEAMCIATRVMMENDMDGSLDGDTCDEDCGHCDCGEEHCDCGSPE